MEIRELEHKLNIGAQDWNHGFASNLYQTWGGRAHETIQILRFMVGDEDLTKEMALSCLDFDPMDTNDVSAPVHFAFISQTGYWCVRQFNLGNRFAVERLMGVVMQLRKGLQESGEDLPDRAEVVYNALVQALENAVSLATGVKPQPKEKENEHTDSDGASGLSTEAE